jgi:hypothetical protein
VQACAVDELVRNHSREDLAASVDGKDGEILRVGCESAGPCIDAGSLTLLTSKSPRFGSP